MTDDKNDPIDPRPEDDMMPEPEAEPMADAGDPVVPDPAPPAAEPTAAAAAPPAEGFANYPRDLDPIVGPSAIVTQEDKTQGMLVWVLSIFIGIMSPIIFMLRAKENPFVYRHSMQ